MPLLRDRRDAGQKLAQQLLNYANRPDLIVLGLPRGGVPVAFEVAQALHATLDIFLVRKLGVPGRPELAMGAITSGGVRVLNQEVVTLLHIADATIDAVAQREGQELERRARTYRDNHPAVDVHDCTVILVDDGLATGASMAATVTALRLQAPAQIVAAVPVAAPEICAAFAKNVDHIVCAETPEPFFGIGLWYADFSPTSDDAVRDLLARASHRELSDVLCLAPAPIMQLH